MALPARWKWCISAVTHFFPSFSQNSEKILNSALKKLKFFDLNQNSFSSDFRILNVFWRILIVFLKFK